MLSKEELENLSQLLLSVNERNLEVAFELMKQGDLAKHFISELFAVHKMDVRVYSQKAKELLERISGTVQGLSAALKGRAYLDSSASSSNIKKYAKLCSSIDPDKLALAIYNKYDSGFQYLFSEFSEEALKPILNSKIENGVLKLSRKTITKIPKALLAYTKLEVLDLPYNQVKSLPTAIHQLKSLKKLNLRSNQVKKIHKNIGKLKHLEMLEVEWNKLESLPDELADLTSLKELRLGYNSFEEFPLVITKIPNLEKLAIGAMMDYYANVDKIPAAFFNLKTNRLIELTLREPTDSNSQRPWKNLPIITRITGTYEDPISTQPLDIARRAFDQNKEAITFLLKQGTEADKLKVYNYILQNKMTSEKHARYLSVILKEAPAELKKRALSFYIRNEVLFFDKEIKLEGLPAELATFSITEMEWVGRFSEITAVKSFWNFLEYVPSIERIVIAKDIHASFSEKHQVNIPIVLSKLKTFHLGDLYLDWSIFLSQVDKLPVLEDLKLHTNYFLNTEEEIEGIFKRLLPLQSLKHLKIIELGCFSMANQVGISDEILQERIEEGLMKLLPNCAVTIHVGL
ncbi:MAG: leucine-rich repeat domain-containing protein [Aureispira sp.]|nr:leucine-rich repeat domain-containing protein [Aureispira sp.]